MRLFERGLINDIYVHLCWIGRKDTRLTYKKKKNKYKQGLAEIWRGLGPRRMATVGKEKPSKTQDCLPNLTVSIKNLNVCDSYCNAIKMLLFNVQ